MALHTTAVSPGVWHIQDAMGVCMTLIAGRESAVLIDAGYGLEDVPVMVRSLTDLPVRLILTHGHHDHALGARWFDEVWVHRDDLADYRTYTDEAHRRRVLAQAEERGVPVDGKERFLSDPMPEPRVLAESELDLGGLSVRVIHCPGHTPGSLMFLVPSYRLLLTGDDWNPCTWLFFPEAADVGLYRRNMLRAVKDLQVDTILCSHQPAPYPVKALSDFLACLTVDCLDRAADTPEGAAMGIQTARAVPAEGQMLVFDRNKYLRVREEMRNERF